MNRFTDIATATEGMNDFQKFLFFRNKADQLDIINKITFKLFYYCNLSSPELCKRLRLSSAKWYSYMRGEAFLPDGLVDRMKKRFEKELQEAQQKEEQAKMDWYRDRAIRNLEQADKSITSPEKATA